MIGILPGIHLLHQLTDIRIHQNVKTSWHKSIMSYVIFSATNEHFIDIVNSRT